MAKLRGLSQQFEQNVVYYFYGEGKEGRRWNKFVFSWLKGNFQIKQIQTTAHIGFQSQYNVWKTFIIFTSA